jgi:competence protein ComGF
VLSQNNLSVPIENVNTCQGLAELNEVQTVESNRLYFSLDVKPKQKAIYKSDRFNQKDKTKTNGHITRIQGIKTGKPAKSSVLPRIHVSDVF